MQRFTQLYSELDQTTRTTEKVAALERYFTAAPAGDAAWALQLLTGRKLMRSLPHPRLRSWVAEETALPPWLVDECHDAVGDLSETLSLLQAEASPDGTDLSLTEVIEQRLLPLRELDADAQRALLVRSWREFSRMQRFLLHKLISGSFRVGVAERLVVRALAQVAGIEPALLTHRLMGPWEPTAGAFAKLVSPDGDGTDPARPYPFLLAHPLETAPEVLGNAARWQAEWKWDGIRTQLIRRRGTVVLWSRGEAIVNPQFPELVDAAARLPDGVVLDGEILGWERDQPLPFAALQRRLNRKRVDLMLFPECPVLYMAFDLLEFDQRDLRETPLHERRAQLDALLTRGDERFLRVSPEIAFSDWDQLQAHRGTARERHVEGIMLKRRDARYGVGRVRGAWWKWKIAPHTIDAVLIYAQLGHGRRASIYTDYTFGVWAGDELVPIAKAYSGLTDAEIRRVDSFIRQNTVGRSGPLRIVRPALVFELAFERAQPSSRHKSGIALRFPRMARWRHDKQPTDADTLETVRGLVPHWRPT